MIQIKVSIPGFGNNIKLSQFLGTDNNCYNNCRFHVNNPELREADFWFVIDDLQLPVENVRVSPRNIYFLSAEITHNNGYYDTVDKSAFLDQFSRIISCLDIFRDNAAYDIPFLAWMINANHGPSIFDETSRDFNWLMELNHIEKSKLISVFSSSKTMTPDHYARVKFVKKLKAHFGDKLDWYGNGVQPLDRKWDGIAPYKYHIALENRSRHNVITEKIYDSYLGLAYPIYWGAPNLDEYFTKDSFTPIELINWRGAIDTIERVLDEDLWGKSHTALLESKRRVLTDYNTFLRIANMAIEGQVGAEQDKKAVSLYSTREIVNRIPGLKLKRVISLGGKFLQQLGRKLEMQAYD